MLVLEGCVPWPEAAARRYQKAGYWRGEALGDLLRGWAREYQGRPAVVDGNRRLTYQDLHGAADRAALGFQGLGVGPSDRVVLHLPNTADFLIVAFGLFRIGAIPVFALPAHREYEISYFCDHSDAVAYVGAQDSPGDLLTLGETLRAKLPGLHHVVVADVGEDALDRPGFVSLPAMLDHAHEDGREALDSLRPDAAEVAFFLLSGGTTGLPKLIPRTHNDYAYNLSGSAQVCGFDEETVYLVSLPISHNFPFGCPGALGTLHAGGRVVFNRDPSPSASFALIEQERVTATALVPALALRWMESPQHFEHDLSSLRLLQVGGARLVPEIARRVRPELGCTLQQVFGMAEGLLNFTRADDPEDVILETQGRPMSPADELRIVDEAGQSVAEGEAGELHTRGPYTLRGYYRAETHNARAFTEDGFYRTGDIVRMHPSGSLVVEGRAKDLINRGGEKISAEEVEDLVLAHPAVFNVAAVAMPDRELGERTCAYVIPRQGTTVTLEELTSVLAERGVAKYKWPERLELVGELPVTTVGKIDKKALRADLAAKVEAERGKS